MRKFNSFFIIGTTGIIVTSIMHIFLTLGLSVVSVHSSFYVIYATFIAFLAISFGHTSKNNEPKSN